MSWRQPKIQNENNDCFLPPFDLWCQRLFTRQQWQWKSVYQAGQAVLLAFVRLHRCALSFLRSREPFELNPSSSKQHARHTKHQTGSADWHEFLRACLLFREHSVRALQAMHSHWLQTQPGVSDSFNSTFDLKSLDTYSDLSAAVTAHGFFRYVSVQPWLLSKAEIMEKSESLLS